MARKSKNETIAMAADAGGASAPAETANEGSRKRIITYEWDANTGMLSQLRDKSVVARFDMAVLNSDIHDRLRVHGLRQKLADSHAGKIPDAETLAMEVWENLVAGNWYGARGEGAERTSLFLEAYVRVMNGRGNPLTVDDFRKIVNDIESGDDDDKKKTLRGVRDNPDIVRAMNEIREERAAARRGDSTVSLDAIL